MGLRLKITSGPVQGKEFPVKAESVVGRAVTEIQVNDPKISGRHAKIQKMENGDFYLVDLGSKAGIRMNSQRFDKIKLEPGVAFRLGRTRFTVIDDSAPTIVELNSLPDFPVDDPILVSPVSSPMVQKPMTVVAPKEPAHPPPPKEPEWFEYLANFAFRAQEKISNEPRDLSAFTSLLVLRVMTGIQAGTEWVLGYGPRDVGLGSLDLPLFEDGLPPIAFTVTADGADVIFSTRHSSQILLNGRSVSSDTLVAGDEIHIGQTKIKVSFKE